MKFATPIIAKGKVYFGTESELDVFGLLSTSARAKGTQPPRKVGRTAEPSSQKPGMQSGEHNPATEQLPTFATR
jgi:hypothetical protein